MNLLLRLSLLAVLSSIFGCTSRPSTPESPHTLHLSTPQKIKGFDPVYSDDVYSGTEVGRVYDNLLQYNYLKRPYVLEPMLAESLPKISDGGKTFTFKIKKGILFQDDVCFQKTGGRGRELVAEDFVYSFKRVADPQVVSPGWWIFEGKVLGLGEWREQTRHSGVPDYSKEVEGLKALDSHTLQIKIAKPSYQFLYYLSMAFASPVAREAVEFYGKDFLRNPVGTGPFMNVRQETNLSSRLVYVRNPNYWADTYPKEGEPRDQAEGMLEDAGKKLPLVDKIVVDVHVKSQPMFLNFQAGKLDLAGIPKDNFHQVITPSKDLSDEFTRRGVRLNKMAMLDVAHESFNMEDPVLGKNKFLRQAISLAINSDAIIDYFHNGRAIPAQSPIPPGLAGYDPKLVNPYRQYNLAKAKELMVKAGFPGGQGLTEIEYGTVQGSTQRQSAEFLQKSLGDIGIKLKVNVYTWPEFQAAIKNRKLQMWGYAWAGDYPDAENFLQLFYSKNISPGPNDANYANPAFDKLYEEALTLPDGAKRTAIYKKMVEILVEDCPWVFLMHRLDYSLIQPWLKNYKANDLDYHKARYYRIVPELKSGK